MMHISNYLFTVYILEEVYVRINIYTDYDSLFVVCSSNSV